MIHHPLISIITPSFNQAQFIQECILSVKEQIYPYFEHIIIDGGSEDETVKILKKYPHLRWISEPDKGQADAVNKGFKMAKGEIVGWLNADDLYLAHTLKIVSHYFETHSHIHIVYGDCEFINEQGKVIELFKGQAFNLLDMLGKNFMAQPTVFFKREVVEKIGYLNEKLHHCMDFDYWIRVALSGLNFTYIPQVLAKFRWHKGQKTIKEMHLQSAEHVKVIRKYAKNISAKEGIKIEGINDLMKKNIRKIFIYGTGKAGEIIFDIAKERGFEILGFLTSQKSKWGSIYLGKRIFSFEEIKNISYDAIIIASQYISSIKKTLEEEGINKNIIVPIVSYLPAGFHRLSKLMKK